MHKVQETKKHSLLVLLRPGDSELNLTGRIAGNIDSPLALRGKEQARQAGEKLRGFVFDTAFCSSLRRARQALEIVLEESAPVLSISYCSELDERNIGIMSGKRVEDLEREYGKETVFNWRYMTAPPGGEALENSLSRAEGLYESIIRNMLEAGHNIIVAGHNGTLRGIIKAVERLSIDDARKRSVNCVEPVIYEITPCSFDAELAKAVREL